MIPLVPGESAEAAIARIYAGGVAIVFDPADDSMRLEPIDDDGDARGLVVPDGFFEAWWSTVSARLWAAFGGWDHEVVDGFDHLWAPGCRWQVEWGGADVTLRYRRSTDQAAPGLSDRDLLGCFVGVDAVLHWPDDHGSYLVLDGDAELPELIA